MDFLCPDSRRRAAACEELSFDGKRFPAAYSAGSAAWKKICSAWIIAQPGADYNKNAGMEIAFGNSSARGFALAAKFVKK